MKKFKRWIRNKLRKFLYVDELESSLSELNAFIQTSKSNLEYEIKRLDSKNLEYDIKRLDSKIDQKEYNTNIMYKGLKQDISHFQDLVNALHNSVENVVHIGTDVRREPRGSWAVICIEGKMNIVKFVDLDRKDARDVMMFLKQFEAGKHCIDTPYKEMFYDGLFKF